MKKSQVLKTKKKSKKGKVILASMVAVLMAVGFGGRSAFAGIFDIIGGQFPWLNSVLGDASGLNLETPNFDLASGFKTILGDGMSGDTSKLLREDGSLNLSEDQLVTTQDLVLGSGLADARLDFSSMDLGMGQSSLLTSATASVAASTNAHNNSKISQKVSEESASVWEKSLTPSNSTLEAEEKSIVATVAAGRAAIAYGAHAETANKFSAIQAKNSLDEKNEKLFDGKITSATGGAFKTNTQRAFELDRDSREKLF
jgi:hypothetical protein